MTTLTDFIKQFNAEGFVKVINSTKSVEWVKWSKDTRNEYGSLTMEFIALDEPLIKIVRDSLPEYEYDVILINSTDDVTTLL